MVPYINIHTHRPKGIDIEIVNILDAEGYRQSDYKFCSLSLHPWYLDNWEVKAELIKKHAVNPSVLAIGECGLDKLAGPEMDVQLKAFESQINIAKEVNKPVIVHLVKAVQEFIKLIKLNPEIIFIVHGYNNNLNTLKSLLDHGCYISLGSALMNEYSNSFKCIHEISMDKLFLETDDSSFSIKEIYNQAAMLLGVDEQDIKKDIFSNYTKVFS